MSTRGFGCPHGNGDPSRCSQCLGTPARQVTVAGGEVAINGVPVSSSADQQRDAAAAMALRPRHRRVRRRQ